MIWLIPILLVCLFLLFRFVSPYEDVTSREVGWGWRQGQEQEQEQGQEGFQATAPPLVSDAFRTAYDGFLQFYPPFMERWRDALLRAHSLEQPVEGGKKEEGGKKDPTEADLAGIITGLTSSLGKPFPPPSIPRGPLPASSALQTLEDIDRARLMTRIPAQVDPYRNALEWMNDQLLRAEKELEEALKGGGLPALEGFEEKGSCAELSQCFRDNPDLVRQLLEVQEEEAGQRLDRIQKELMARFQQFQQPKLMSAFELNGRLVRKAKETEAKAKSGDWIKDVRMGGSKKGPPLQSPPGGDALEELRRKDPERYKQLQEKNASLFSLKQLMEQINRGLRS